MDGTDSGILYVVSTPIGNMEDISFRAVRVLKSAGIIAAEDTRRTRILMMHYGIDGRLESYHDFNKEKKTTHLVNILLSGQDIALVSDAGTPGISDPAYRLIQAALKHGVHIVPIPGATAAITAVSVSGLPTDRFAFEGFLPVKKGRRRRLDDLKTEKRTIILYESPHRLIRTLQDLCDTLGDRSVAVCRELTKKFEEIVRTTLSDAVQQFSKRTVRGEFVLIIHGDNEK
ncbi:16S rRNA (cytidine(1402)-2'-O)-methyltransferase [bacterium]|nr:16S rRNA (cytidine(1402)-2'-O)-methyltransferase [bacterium]